MIDQELITRLRLESTDPLFKSDNSVWFVVGYIVVLGGEIQFQVYKDGDESNLISLSEEQLLAEYQYINPTIQLF